ncbi:MAG: hypothetical protein L7V87_05115 [Verrucomicrobiales bacterium]|nr:hypothetical protein [Verrucomicrobiales bacterium]
MRSLPLLLFSFLAQFASTTDFHISPDGDDGNTRAAGSPGLTIQRAAETVPAGSNVIIHEGVYQKKVNVEVSGSAGAGLITFKAAQGETTVIDGTNLPFDPNSTNALFVVIDQYYIRVRGLELRNYKTAQRYLVPIWILVEGAPTHIG